MGEENKANGDPVINSSYYCFTLYDAILFNVLFKEFGYEKDYIFEWSSNRGIHNVYSK